MHGCANEFVAVTTPVGFRAVGQFYQRFDQVGDDEVVRCLHDARRAAAPPSASRRGERAVEREVGLDAGPVRLPGHLVVPAGASGLVVFAHGSGSSRHSPRNRFVAEQLQARGLATLLFALLTGPEAADRAAVFDVALLAERLRAATEALREGAEVAQLPVGYFGASTGAAAALTAAAGDPSIGAVVSRGGRPDLAGEHLARVTCPTLLIVGGDDRTVLRLNREAQAMLRCVSELRVVDGATHLFEEPGTLEAAADAAADWFETHLGSV